MAPTALLANPQDGVVSAGSATISSAGSTLTINQSTDKAVIDWRGFDIGAGETTRFNQPSNRSLTLNRVGSGQASRIEGNLSANGNIIIVNPNGVLFGAGSKVDVNGLVATTADISNANLMVGHLAFDVPGNPNATIENRGEITAKDAGLVGLVAPNVINSGVIRAKLGRIQLSSGDTATVDLYGDGLIEVKASDALRHQLVDNSGKLIAEGGTIAMTAAAGRQTVDSLVHVGGELDARGIGTKNGKIFIYAEGSKAGMQSGHSRVVVDGKLDVSNATGKGGKVEILGDVITLASTANINADGATGAGIVHVGGEIQGGGTTPTATTITMEQGAVITANALIDGKGGEVVVYADDRTEFNGRISANGEGDGDGGFIETSGRVALLINTGTVSATTRRGRQGEWLLDPADITITAATNTNVTGGTPFTATATGSQVSAATIKSILDAGTNVTIQTSNDGYAGNGDITVSSAITTTGSGGLTLSAYRDINVNAGITLNAGGLVLRADNSGIGTGAVNITAAINKGAGAMSIIGNDLSISGAGAITNTGTLTISNSAAGGTIGVGTAATGTMNISFTELGLLSGTVYAFGSLTGGDLTINTAYNFASHSVVFNSGGNINVAASIAKTSGVGAGYIFRAGGNIYNTSNASISSTSNGLNITLQSDYDDSGSGAVSFTGGSLTTNGGDLTIGGGSGTVSAGSGYAVGDGGTYLSGVTLSGTVNASGGNILINGKGNNGAAGGNHGVNSSATMSTSGSGTVTIYGIGQGNTNSASDRGVVVGGSITTVNGAITINGTGGGAGSGINNYGVQVTASNGLKTTGTGSISVTGVAGGGGASSGSSQHGIVVGAANGITTTGTGNITMTGTAGVSSGQYNYGIALTTGGSVTTTGGGNVTMTGNGAAGTNSDNNGIVVDGATVSAAGTGTVTMTGTGNGATNATASRGVYVANAGVVSTVNGALTITGTGGGAGTGNNNQGVYVTGASSTIKTTGTGNMVITGTGGTGSTNNNHGIYSAVANGIQTTGGGNITLKGVKGTGTSYGVQADVANEYITSGSGAITIYSDTPNITIANAINAGGVLTMATYTNMGMSVGTNVASTLNITNTMLGYLAGASYVFGSTTTGTGAANTGDTTVNTTKDFVNAGVSFIAGGNISLAGTLTKATGASTANYLFQANGNISNTSSAGIAATTGGINLTLNSDYDQGTSPGGTITLTSASVTTNGGNIVLGGGTSPSTLYAYSASGAAVNFSGTTLNANGGNITINGSGYNRGVRVINSTVKTTSNGTLAINGIAAYASGGTQAFGLDIDSSGGTALIETQNGTMTLTGTASGGTASNFGIAVQANSGGTVTVRSTGSGAVNMTGTSSGTGATDLYMAVGAYSSSTGNVTLTADAINFGGTSTISAGNTLTLQNRTAIAMNIGTGYVSNSSLSRMTAASYVFGSTTATGLTVNTTNDFVDGNITFISGGNINLASALTKATGTGTANYNFQAYGNVTNTSNIGVTATTGAINLTLDSDYDNNATGTITLTGGTFSTGAGNILLNDALSMAGDVSLTTTGGNVTLNGTVNGDTAGTRSLIVAARTGTFTTGTTVGATNKLNNLSVTADDAVLGGNVYGSGTITLQTYTASRSLNVGMGASNGTNFNISSTEVGYLQEGWASILIGSTSSSDYTNVSTTAYTDPLTLRGNYIRVYGNITATDNASVTFTANATEIQNSSLSLTTQNNAISIANGYVMYSNNFTINSNGGGITLGRIVGNIAAIGTNSITSGGGNISIGNGANALQGTATSGGISVNAGTGTLTFSGALNGAMDVTATAATITSATAWGGTTAMGNVNLTATNDLSLPAITTAAAKNVTVTVTGANKTLTTTGALTAGTAGNMTLSADNMTIGGNLAGTGTLTLQPNDSTRPVYINYGSTDGTNLNISTAELAYLQNGWGTINMGKSGSTGAMYIGASSFADPVVFRSANTHQITGALTTTDNATATFSSASAGTNFISSGSIAADGAISFSAYVWMNKATTLSTTNDNITFSNTIFAGPTFTLNAGSGTIAFNTISRSNSAGSAGLNGVTATAGAFTFAANIGAAGASAMDAISLTSTSGISLPNIFASSIFVRTTGATSDISIASGKTLTATGAGDAITLVSGRNFLNSATTPFAFTGGGRFLVYSTNPASDTLNGRTSNFVRYSCTYGGSCPSFASETGNGFLYSYTPTLTITPTAIGAIYGDAVSLSGYGYSVTSGYLTSAAGSDSAADVLTGSLTGATTYTQGSNVGSYNVNYSSGSLASKLGYGFTYANNATAITVGQRTLVASLTGTVSKTYDGDNTATLTGANYSLSNVYGADSLGISNTAGTYNNKNVGTGKNVTVTGLTLTGAKAANYVLSSSSVVGAVGTITQKALTLTGLSATDKVYNGNTTAALTGTASFSGLVGGDTVTLGGTGAGAFADKNVGTGKAVTVTGYTISGADSGNYVFTQPTGLTADITAKALTVSGMTGVGRVYDGTTVAGLTGTAALSGLVGGDTVTLGGTAAGAFADKNVGVGKAITVTGYSISGADAGNYSFSQPTGLTATITAKALTLTGLSADDKIYDGNSVAALSGTASFSGLVGGDTVTLGGTGAGAFANKNVGTNKAVTVTGYSISGADSGNYVFAQPTGLTADITAKALTLTGLSANDKVYNGNTVAALSGTASFSGLIGGDTVTLGGTGAGAFADKNVGTGKAVTVSGYSISGADAGNYSFSQPTGLTADIATKAITITGIAATDRTYDATTTAAITGTAALSGLVGGDAVSLGGTASGSFADKNVGLNKAVTVTGYSISGGDSGNYSLAQPTGLVADINALAVTVSGLSANDKVYDGTTAATLAGTAALSGVIGGDVVTLGGTGTGAFGNKNVGTNKAVSVSGYSISGADAGNYSFSQPTGISADITVKSLTLTGLSANDKVYNGNTVATLAGTAAFSGLVGGDAVTLGGTGAGAFANKNVGTNKAVTVTGYTISGADAGNYSFAQPTGLSADITVKSLTLTGLTGSNKVYDGTANASYTGTALFSGLVGGDAVTLGGAGSATFADKNVGTGKAITITGYSISGTDAGNYSFSQPSGLTGNITVKALTLSGLSADDKVYNGNTVAALSGTASFSGLVGGDTVTLGGTGAGAFANKNVGTNKAVTVTGYTISGADAGNYSFAQPTGLTADITAKALTVSGLSANDKVYSGTTAATLAGTAAMSGLVGGDTVTLGGTVAANFADKNVGVGKAVTVAGYTIGGADAGNYSFSQPTGFTADITKKQLDVTAGNKTITYGNAIAAGTVTYSGFVAGESAANLSTGATVASTASGIVDAGTYTGNYVASGAAAANYSFNYVAGNLTVNQRALTVTTNAASKVEGDPDPVFSGSNNLIASDIGQISWAYAPVGYAGVAGSYVIAATATDPSSRLANYIRTNNYGSLVVNSSTYVPPPPPPPPAPTPIPDSVVQMSQLPAGYNTGTMATASPIIIQNFVSNDSTVPTPTGNPDADNAYTFVYQAGDRGAVQGTLFLPHFLTIDPALQQQLGIESREI